MNVRKIAFSGHNVVRRFSTSPLAQIYLHKGSRIPGLKKDPEEVFTSYKGQKYGISEENLGHIKKFLNDKYKISDDLILQILTHKSFGNGIKPFNEKLSAMGSKILNLFCAKHVIEQPTNNENAISGRNFDCLGSPMSKELSGRMSLGLFAQLNKLNTVMFWKSYNHELSFEASGEMKVSAQMVYALIGAVTFVHGKKTAEEFIREKLFKSNTSIEDITSEVVQKYGSN
ncbi:Piso0_005725 [Millerozyma farinosa CBS 7064]|uniref:Piso0_005725 protein n=1 Tax=Pichia sorbitophila (strain ATCC MYA-4447 / BCRC 22081 / CBS 7064 / NBRC 10061 / NRRL Y-12695) TaxID=559304 RepID=G8Y2R5_PICSO|nr:Piso0_005725 [Millerozyma farinosa CBS 7064]